MRSVKKINDTITVTLTTEDQHKISARHYSAGRRDVIILAHGFFNNKDVYLFRAMAEKLFETYDVVAFDFRGHGQSSGFFSWSAQEDQELAAVSKYVKDKGYRRIGLMGFSLGAAVALIFAEKNKDIHSVIAVSAPYDFWKIDFHFWEPEMLRDLGLNLGLKGKGKGVRPGNPFNSKVKPLDVVANISPTPCLFVHGSKDWLIKPLHSEKLFQKAIDPKRIVIISGAGHAEMIFDTHPQEFLKTCHDWFEQTLKS